jgi:hypothetical protein
MRSRGERASGGLAVDAARRLLMSNGRNGNDDADRNGEISAIEHSGCARWMFETMDADHDGEATAVAVGA